ncbi:head-tail joining protein [Variovorax ureilyticus]|uniref:head-tail joining protein n=1 Tax=Variovorax ureilyticus TaxID=1836198 RepID=UPI003D675788
MIDWDSLVLGPLQGVFGEAVTHLPATGDPQAGSGIFDEAYREVDLAGGMAVTTEHPVLGIRISDYPVLPVQGDQVIVHGMTFVIREVQVDGHGAAKLLLNEAI